MVSDQTKTLIFDLALWADQLPPLLERISILATCPNLGEHFTNKTRSCLVQTSWASAPIKKYLLSISCSLRAACFGSYQFAASQSLFKMTKAELQSFKAHLPKLRRRIKKTPAYSLMRSAPLPTKLQKGRRIRRPWIWEARKTEEESSHRD